MKNYTSIQLFWYEKMEHQDRNLDKKEKIRNQIQKLHIFH